MRKSYSRTKRTKNTEAKDLSSNSNDSLEEINHKLQLIVENAFLSRLDLMFSVLLSLTIFLLGLLLNNPLPRMGLFSVFWIVMLTLFIYTLIGEFYAIIKGDIVGRFKFWVGLVFDFITLGFLVFIFVIFLIFPASMIFLGFTSLLWVFFFPIFIHYIDNLFYKYVRRFPSRFNDFPVKEWGKLLFPLAVGHILIIISFLLAYYYLVLKA
jgi:hypothetical protein